MLIRAYGLFWRADEIDWTPGAGRSADGVRRFALLGRRRINAPGLRLADFREQRGIYILYGNYGPYYVGVTIERGLGTRLKEHLGDVHAGEWDRFSWFGFRRVLAPRRPSPLGELAEFALGKYVDQGAMIMELEALLINAMALRNVRRTRFPAGERWEQVRLDERAHFLGKLG